MTRSTRGNNPDGSTTVPGIPMPPILSASRLAEARREAFRRLLAQEGLTCTELAQRAGFPTPNRLYNFLAGRSGSLSANTLLRIGAVLPHVSLTHLVVPDHIDPGIRMIGHDTVVVGPTSTASEPTMSATSRQAANPVPFAGIQRCIQRLEAELMLLKRLLTDMQAQYRGRSG